MDKKRYWLRGGIIGVFIFALWALEIFGDKVFFPGSWIFVHNIFFHLGILNPIENPFFDLAFYVTSFIFLFFPFVILGWLYGKFKNRNKVV